MVPAELWLVGRAGGTNLCGHPELDEYWVTFRRVAPVDVPTVARLERLLYTELLESPSFSGINVESEQEYEAEWQRMADGNERYEAFLAELGDEVVGQLFLYRRAEGDLRVPPQSIDLASASISPSCRGRGIATALTWTAIAWAQQHDLETIITD